MAYIGTLSLKEYLGIGTATTTDDSLLGSLVTAAQGAIETYCRRKFESTNATRYYNQQDARIVGDKLYLDADLIAVQTLVNGNASTIVAASFWLLPRNEGTAYSIIRLKSSEVWTFNTDSEITVAGTWGYSATAPADIVQATKRMAAYYYRSKDAANQFSNVTGFVESGQLTIEKGIPTDVEVLLKPYRRSQYG